MRTALLYLLLLAQAGGVAALVIGSRGAPIVAWLGLPTAIALATVAVFGRAELRQPGR